MPQKEGEKERLWARMLAKSLVTLVFLTEEAWEAKEQASGKSMELQMGLMAPEWEMTALELEMETETR